MKRLVQLGVVAALALAATAACAGGDDDDSQTRADFQRKADAICLDAQSKLQAIPSPETFGDFPLWARQYVPVARKQVERLRNLDPPAGDEETFTQFVDAMASGVEIVNEIGRAVQRGQAQRARQLIGESQTAIGEAQRQANALGLQICSPAGQ